MYTPSTSLVRGLHAMVAIMLGPVYLVFYLLSAAFLYLFVAIAFDLPLPGATRGKRADDLPPPEYGGRGGPGARRKKRP